MDKQQARLFSGGHKGAEAEFGRAAEQWNIPETTLSFEGHPMEHSGEVVTLTDEELARGDVSMDFVFTSLGRTFHRGKGIRRVIQSMFHVVTRGNELFAVGWILPDNHVKGGTGWGVELAKFFNREVSVFDQEKERWFTWTDGNGRRAIRLCPTDLSRPQEHGTSPRPAKRRSAICSNAPTARLPPKRAPPPAIRLSAAECNQEPGRGSAPHLGVQFARFSLLIQPTGGSHAGTALPIHSTRIGGSLPPRPAALDACRGAGCRHTGDGAGCEEARTARADPARRHDAHQDGSGDHPRPAGPVPCHHRHPAGLRRRRRHNRRPSLHLLRTYRRFRHHTSTSLHLLQRGPGLRVAVDAPRLHQPQATGDRRRGLSGAALRSPRQSPLDSRRGRHRLRQSRQHGLLPGARRRDRPGDLLRSRGRHQVPGRLDRCLRLAGGALALPKVPDW